MSQIMTINQVKVTNIDLAKEVAKNLQFETTNEDVRGIGNGRADFVFKIAHGRNFGLKLNSEGSYDILCDRDVENLVKQSFVVNYVKEFAINEIKLQGKTFVLNENENEIEIRYIV